MAKTKQEFQAAIAAAISSYPTAAQFYQAQDPRLLAQLDAVASMLAMLTTEIDIAAMEPFVKARDATVLADCAIKGVLPFGRAALVSVRVESGAAVPVVLASGRELADPQGRPYRIEVGATVPAGGDALIQLRQVFEDDSLRHTVFASDPFYRIEIPKRAAGRVVSGLRVSLRENGKSELTLRYAPEFANALPGERVFHIETDEQRRLFVVLGHDEMSGFTAQANMNFAVSISECDGAFTLMPGAPFALDSAVGNELALTLKLDAVLMPGAEAHNIDTLRQLASYPAIYDSSAIYLGNFDFLIRRKLGDSFRFLSVWNETVEENTPRGANIANMNTLFVAFEPAEGFSGDALKREIVRLIRQADDSYRVRFLPVSHKPIPISINARVSDVYNPAALAEQIKARVIAEYGQGTTFARRGRSKVLYKHLYSLLVNGFPSLQTGESDLQISVNDPLAQILPEQWRYVSADSVTIAITSFAGE